jgi:hypothetical protein
MDFAVGSRWAGTGRTKRRWIEVQMKEGGYDVAWVAGGGMPKYEPL